jgi:hypothetical protein
LRCDRFALEASRGLAETFDSGRSRPSEAIDRTHAELARGITPEFVVSPTPAEFAKEVLSLPW